MSQARTKFARSKRYYEMDKLFSSRPLPKSEKPNSLKPVSSFFFFTVAKPALNLILRVS